MTSQTSYWNRLIQPGIVALVGAGGKTTVLSKLVEYGRLKGQPIVVTTTTRLYESQVAHYKPIYTQNINEADEYCTWLLWCVVLWHYGNKSGLLRL